jgi:hypothetical protein
MSLRKARGAVTRVAAVLAAYARAAGCSMWVLGMELTPQRRMSAGRA